mgnify:CR=1 FL=1
MGDSFQDTREIREVLDKSVFREEEPTHSQQAEVLEEPVAMEASEEISDAKPEAVAEPTQESEQEPEQPLSRMSRRSRKAGVETTKAEASKVEENTEELEADVAVEPIRRQSKRPVPLAIPFVLSLLISYCMSGCRFNPFATNQQSQNLYAGWAMTKGQVPFGDFYGTNGLLYYVINWLEAWLVAIWILMILQAIALFFSGYLSLSGCASTGV